ncbi:hypothetical protein CHELA41_23252 [Hyphomicrobiales bacterium]|nr:hypothetical protein CHELA41_23252 [Hyphomicrobiales bacterium]
MSSTSVSAVKSKSLPSRLISRGRSSGWSASSREPTSASWRSPTKSRRSSPSPARMAVAARSMTDGQISPSALRKLFASAVVSLTSDILGSGYFRLSGAGRGMPELGRNQSAASASLVVLSTAFFKL